MPIFEGAATVSNHQMTFNWKDNSGMGNAERTDIVMVLVYNKDREAAVYDTEAALRSDCHAGLQLPEDWQDDELVAYLSFCSTDGNCVANSICLPISVIEIPEEEIDVQTESIDTTHKRILPDKRTVHQSRITVHSLSAPPNEIQTYRYET